MLKVLRPFEVKQYCEPGDVEQTHGVGVVSQS